MPRSITRAVLACATLLLAAVPPAVAQTDKPLKPENPVGPVSYKAWHYPGGDLPKEEPQSVPAPYDGPTLVLQSAYVGRKAAEPTIGIDRSGTAFYAAGDFDGTGGQARTEVRRSDDGGVSWRNTTFQVGGSDFPPNTLDPYVYVDSATGRVFSIDLLLAGSFLSYSDDKGETWAASAMSTPGVNDHQTFFTGPPSPANPAMQTQDTFPNVAYYCVNALGYSGCSFSTDGGATFRPLASPPFAACVGCLHGHGVVDKDGRVFLPRGLDEPTTPTGDGPEVAVTDDGALSWDVVRVSEGLPASDPHTAVAVDSAGNAYYVWYDAAQKLPYLSVSKDHGQTWSTPLMVAPPGVHDVNFPMVAAGDPGKIAISFPGSSVDDPEDDTRPWHAWVVVSENALDPDPTFLGAITDAGDDPLHRGTCDGRCGGMFDFIDLQVSPADGTVWGTFTDTCTADNDCTIDRASGLATDAQGVAVHQLFGPRLVGDPLVGPGGGAQTVGPAPSAPAPRDTTRPRIRSLRLTGPKSRRPVLRWKLSELASAQIRLTRGKKVIFDVRTGKPRKSGSLKLRALSRGRYALRFSVTDPAGNVSPAKRLSFRRR